MGKRRKQFFGAALIHFNHMNKYLQILLFPLTFLHGCMVYASWPGKQVFEAKCLSCHNTFHSLNFRDPEVFLNNTAMMQAVVESGYMPPAYSDTTYSRFSNEHVLTKGEKTDLLDWLSRADLKRERFSREETLSPVPDYSLRVGGGFQLPGDNKDHFVFYKIPFRLACDTLVSCIEFIPLSKGKINHHLNYEVVPYHGGMDTGGIAFREVNKDGFNTQELFRQLGLTDARGQLPGELYYGSWLPGMTALRFAPPFAIFMPKQGFIAVNVMHYSPSPLTERDSFQFNFYFTKAYKDLLYRKTEVLITGSGYTPVEPEFVIGPNERKWFHSELVVPNDIIAYSINPHMHKIGRQFIAYATYHGDTLPLIRIKDWNFNFQENYVFIHPIVLKANTRIHIEGYYDNTEENLQNPFLPPQRIVGSDGMLTNEEMLLMGMIYVNLNKSDEPYIKY